MSRTRVQSEEEQSPFSGRNPLEEYKKNLSCLNFEAAKFWLMQTLNVPTSVQFLELSSPGAQAMGDFDNTGFHRPTHSVKGE